MRRTLALLSLAIVASAHGCSNDVDAPQGDAGPQTDVVADVPQGDPQGCSRAGGECGCAGSCRPGFKPAPGALLFACPQPCSGCGACGMQCCLPESTEPDGGGRDAGCTGSFACLCGDAICVDGQWTCGPCN